MKIMKTNALTKITACFVITTLCTLFASCSKDDLAVAPSTTQQQLDTIVPNPSQPTDTLQSGSLSGNLQALFIGHSTMNDIVDDYVKLMSEAADDQTSLTVADGVFLAEFGGGLSLESKMVAPIITELFESGASQKYDFVLLTEQWDYQFYNPSEYGSDTNGEVNGCPASGYTPPSNWATPPDDWYPTPYPLQRYVDAISCGNANTTVFYYQTWSLGFNEVSNGATRPANPDYKRPSVSEIRQLQAVGQGRPDLPLADRIEFEGVKWESFIKAANRPQLRFVPAGYAVARLLRNIEAGTVPGFEAVANSNGLNQNGQLAWTDYIFYQDQYHFASIGHYFVSLVIYASVFNRSPEGLPIGNDNYLASQAFNENQFPLQEISNDKYLELLQQTGAKGVYDLRGYQEKDYIHEDLKIYLQRLAWQVVQEDSEY